MPAPSVRYKILPARGDKTALDAAIAAIDEGEICYARDEDRFYVKEGGVLVLTSMEEAPNDGTQYVRRNEAWEAVDVPPGTVVSNVAPVAPDDGQLWYDTEDARIFVWTGTEWADASPDAGNPTVITSDSAPGAPQDGDLWFRTSDGRMYVYYDDGASSQWVDANPATGASNWSYDGTTLAPLVAGTDVDLGTGDLSAANGTFGDYDNGSGSRAWGSYGMYMRAPSTAGGSVFQMQSSNGGVNTQTMGVRADGTVEIGGTIPTSPNITLNADGSSYFKGKIDADKRIGVFLNTPPSTTDENAIVVSDGVNSKVIIKANGDGAFGPGTGSFGVNQDGCYFEGSTGTLIVTKDSGAAAGVDSAVWRSGQFGLGETITLNANGTATFTGNITAPNVSDVKFKTDIQPASPQLADVVALGNSLKNWTWTEEAPLQDNLKSKRFLGLIAQEAEKVCPQLVYTVDRGGGDADYKALNNDILVMKLLGAVAEQNARIEALESANAALEARLSTLEGN